MQLKVNIGFPYFSILSILVGSMAGPTPSYNLFAQNNATAVDWCQGDD